MKWAPFRADSLNNTPLFPRMPTGFPQIFANPVTRVCKRIANKKFQQKNKIKKQRLAMI